MEPSEDGFEHGSEDWVSYRSRGSEIRDGGARGSRASGTEGAAQPSPLPGPDSDIESGCSTPRPPANRKGSRYNGESTRAVASAPARLAAARGDEGGWGIVRGRGIHGGR